MYFYPGLLVSLFLEYVRPGVHVGAIEALKIGTIVPMLLLLLTLFAKPLRANGQIFAHRNTKWFLFWLFLLFLHTAFAYVTLYAYDVLTKVLGYFLWYYMITRIVQQIDQLSGVFLILVIAHIIALVMNPQVVLDPTSRSYLIAAPYMGDGNDFSLSVCIVIPMAIYLYQETKVKWLKILYAFFIVVLMLTVVGTQSRGAALALAAILLYLWWFSSRKILGIVMLCVVVGGVTLYAPSVYFERMGTIQDYEEDESAMSRIHAWTAAGNMALQRPLTGVGAGHFFVRMGEYRTDGGRGRQMTAHSMYFLVLGEMGIPGISFLVAMLIGNFLVNRRMMKTANRSRDPEIRRFGRLFYLLNGSLLGFAVAATFLSVAYYPHIYIMAAIFTATQLIFQRELKQSTQKLAELNVEPESRQEDDFGPVDDSPETTR